MQEKSGGTSSLVVFLVLATLLASVGGILYGLFTYSNNGHTHDQYADASHTHAAELYFKLCADGEYDIDYSCLHITNRDVSELGTSTRPVVVTFFNDAGDVVGRSGGLGVLCGRYVVTASFLLEPRSASIDSTVVVDRTEVTLLGRTPAQSPNDVEILQGTYLNLNKGYMMLERQGNASGEFVAPVQAGCGFPVGEARDVLPGIALLRLGNLPFGNIEINKATLSDYDSGGFSFQGSLGPFDIGGPIFALRDGHFVLVGMQALPLETYKKGIGVHFSEILEEIELATGIDLSEEK